MTRVYLTSHAIGRYLERVRPSLSPECARQELEQVIQACGAEPMSEPPRWVAEGDREAYLPLTDDMCLTLWGHPGKWTALTLLVRGNLSGERRAARNAARKERKRRARARRAGSALNGR